jgi:hypothetical protein
MDNFITLLTQADLKRLIAGAFDFTKVPDDKKKGVLIMAAHCCLNGPVGTNKRTTFPLIEEEASISGFIGFRVSNNSWKSFCREVAVLLRKSFPEVVQESQQYQVMGDLWPLAPSISEKRSTA